MFSNLQMVILQQVMRPANLSLVHIKPTALFVEPEKLLEVPRKSKVPVRFQKCLRL